MTSTSRPNRQPVMSSPPRSPPDLNRGPSAVMILLLSVCLGSLSLGPVSATTRGLGLAHHTPSNREDPAGIPKQLAMQGAKSQTEEKLVITPLPPCALVVFVHLHKTAGTTIRDWIRKMQEGQWKSHGWNFVRGKEDEFCVGNNCVKGINGLVDLAASDPAAYAKLHGRVFIEDHGGLHDLRSTLRAVQGLRDNQAFIQHGCKALTFTTVREPREYLISLARSHYKYSPLYDILVSRHGNVGLDINDAAWRYDLMKAPQFLENIMTRQLGMWCSSDQTVYPAFGATQRSIQWYNSTVDKATVHRVFDMMLNCFDVIGLTHQVPELLVVLSDAVGFQRVKEEPQNAHRLLESWKNQEYYQAEMDMLNLVADMSHYDHTLYALAEHRWEEQVKVVPRLKERADLVRKQQ